MDLIASAMDELQITQEPNYRGRMIPTRQQSDDDSEVSESKNFKAERRRRENLDHKLCILRCQVPIITKLDRVSIIDAAITYIQELQSTLKVLRGQFLEKDVSIEEENNKKREEVLAEAMKQSDMEEDVVDIVASSIDADKFWVKIIIENRRGRFSRWLEAMDFYGFELSDTNVTTSNGAFLITSWVKNIYGDKLPIHQTRELLLDIITGT